MWFDLLQTRGGSYTDMQTPGVASYIYVSGMSGNHFFVFRDGNGKTKKAWCLGWDKKGKYKKPFP